LIRRDTGKKCAQYAITIHGDSTGTKCTSFRTL
jgi:hypothetical protein